MEAAANSVVRCDIWLKIGITGGTDHSKPMQEEKGQIFIGKIDHSQGADDDDQFVALRNIDKNSKANPNDFKKGKGVESSLPSVKKPKVVLF